MTIEKLKTLGIAGVDYGSKLAGTTAISFIDRNGDLQCLQSEKKQDADQWLLERMGEHMIQSVFIDAPLSLPIRYSTGKGDEFFYRKGDKELSAMSPMFLGGLTARSMKLADQLKKERVECHEIYPGDLARHLNLKSIGYKAKGLGDCLKQISSVDELGELASRQQISNWHRFDSLLALIIAKAFTQGNAQKIGDAEEGQIIVYRPEQGQTI